MAGEVEQAGAWRRLRGGVLSAAPSQFKELERGRELGLAL
jgi:hypothetical protein